MGENPKIVVVDDNTDYLFTMETFLKKNGFPVKTADNGKDGLELIRRRKTRCGSAGRHDGNAVFRI